jgi:hypothetical protein
MRKNWNEITVGQFKRLLEVSDDNDERVFEVVSILSDETLDQTLDRPLEDVRKDIEALEFLKTKPRIRRVRDRYDLGGTVYILQASPQDITTAQYIDFTNEKKDVGHISEMLSIFLVPKGHRYGDGYDFRKVQQDIDRYMSYEDANSVSAFFLGLWILLTQDTVKRTRKALKKAVKEGVITKEEAEEVMKQTEQVLRLTTGSTA